MLIDSQDKCLNFDKDTRVFLDEFSFTGLSLIQALRKHDQEKALDLMRQPIDIDVRDNRGSTALMVAAYRGYSEICQHLLNLGANVTLLADITHELPELEVGDNQPTFHTILDRAEMSNDLPTIKNIFRAWIRAKIVEEDKYAFLHKTKIDLFDHEYLYRAASLGLDDVCLDLLRFGQTMHPDDPSPAIDVALEKGNISTFLTLVAQGADLENLDWSLFESTSVIRDLQRLVSKVREATVTAAHSAAWRKNLADLV